MTKEITYATFEKEVLQSTKPVVIDFYAEWCGPCIKMAPLFDAVANELAATHTLVKINIDNERNLAINHGITSIPTLVFYKDGQKIASENGYMTKFEIQAKIVKHFGTV